MERIWHTNKLGWLYPEGENTQSCLYQDVCECDPKKEDREDDCQLKKFFLCPTLCAVDIPTATEGSAKTCAACLKHNGGNEDNSENHLQDVENQISVHSISVTSVSIAKCVDLVNP